MGEVEDSLHCCKWAFNKRSFSRYSPVAKDAPHAELESSECLCHCCIVPLGFNTEVYAIAVTTHICDGDGRKPVAIYGERELQGFVAKGQLQNESPQIISADCMLFPCGEVIDWCGLIVLP